MNDEEIDLAYLTEIVWEIGNRVRNNSACEADIEALIAIEFVARTPALKRLASGIVDQAMMSGWGEYILTAQQLEASCQSNS